MASKAADQHVAVMPEVRQVLDWAECHFPDARGPLDDGMEWVGDLHVMVEEGGWHTVTLMLTGTRRFVEAFEARFGSRAS